MKLIWDSSRSMVVIHQIAVQVAPETEQSFPVSAVVEEQDTSLILEPSTIITDPGDKPVWYLSNTLESQPLNHPGDVIIRGGNPVRLWAIIHDLERSPSWNTIWIEQALNRVLQLAEEKNFSTIQLPILGAQYGHCSIEWFVTLLARTLKKTHNSALKQIWLVVPFQEVSRVVELLSQFKENR